MIGKNVFICREKLRYQMALAGKRQKEVAEKLMLTYGRFSIKVARDGFKEFQLKIMCEFLECDEDDLLEE